MTFTFDLGSHCYISVSASPQINIDLLDLSLPIKMSLGFRHILYYLILYLKPPVQQIVGGIIPNLSRKIHAQIHLWNKFRNGKSGL